MPTPRRDAGIARYRRFVAETICVGAPGSNQYRSFSANWIDRLGVAVEAICPTFAELILALGAEKFA